MSGLTEFHTVGTDAKLEVTVGFKKQMGRWWPELSGWMMVQEQVL